MKSGGSPIKTALTIIMALVGIKLLLKALPKSTPLKMLLVNFIDLLFTFNFLEFIVLLFFKTFR